MHSPLHQEPQRLDVFRDGALVGSLFDTTPISFEYAPSWLANPRAFALAGITLTPGRIAHNGVIAVFENLLPEGTLREHIKITHHVSTLFALLLEIAGDTAGGFVLVPHGKPWPAARYEPTTWQAIAQALKNDPTQPSQLLQHKGTRISLAGAQKKVLIAVDKKGNPLLPLNTSPSTHIIKSNITAFEGVWNSAVNEAIVMRTASLCGLLTAQVFYEPWTRACIVERFDRYVMKNGTIARSIQYDLCQLAGTASTQKYENDGGPSFIACAELIKRYSTQPAVDITRLLQWLFFNLYVGNNDSHAKNLSIYSPPKQGAQLTPFYDLMCTRLYPGLSSRFAFKIGAEDQPGRISRIHMLRMAKELKVKPDFVMSIASSLYKKLAPGLTQAISELSPAFDPSAKTLAQKLALTIHSIAEKNFRRMQKKA